MVKEKALTFRCSKVDSWLWISGTPTNSDVGNFSVTITATDSLGLASNFVFTIEIKTNNAPTLVSQPNGIFTKTVLAFALMLL